MIENKLNLPPLERLCQHQFVARIPARTVLLDLIARTKNAVRDLDNLNYRKMKKILMNEMVETESTIGADIEDDVSSIQDNDNEGSSKSNSINSEHSLHSQGVTSSAGSSTNSLPVPAGAEALHDLNHHSHSPLQYALHNSHSRNKQSQSQVSSSAIVKSVSQAKHYFLGQSSQAGGQSKLQP